MYMFDVMNIFLVPHTYYIDLTVDMTSKKNSFLVRILYSLAFKQTTGSFSLPWCMIRSSPGISTAQYQCHSAGVDTAVLVLI